MAPNIGSRDARGRQLAGGRGINQKGRPRTGLALTEMIREVAGRPGIMRAWVELVFDVAFGRSVCVEPEWLRACAEARTKGEPPPPRPPNGEVVQPGLDAIQRAWDWLGKYGGFTPPTQLEIGGDERPLLDMGKLTPVELDALENSLAKAAGILDAPELAPRVIDVAHIEVEDRDLEPPRQAGPDPLGLLAP